MVKIQMGHPSQQATAPMGPSPQDLRNLERRLKVLEERFTNIRSKIHLTEQNMLSKNKTIFTEIKTFGLELTDMKKDISELKERLLWFVKEMQGFAKREQLDILKKYIDMWNPVKFVQKKEVEDIVREVIDQMRSEG